MTWHKIHICLCIFVDTCLRVHILKATILQAENLSTKAVMLAVRCACALVEERCKACVNGMTFPDFSNNTQLICYQKYNSCQNCAKNNSNILYQFSRIL